MNNSKSLILVLSLLLVPTAATAQLKVVKVACVGDSITEGAGVNNPAIKEVAREKNVSTVNLYTPLSGRPDLFPDLIHPNAAGAALIARTLHGALLTVR